MTLDELLLEWSYRLERGYPSLDNPSDISTLKQILEELKLPTNKIIDNLKEAGISLREGSDNVKIYYEIAKTAYMEGLTAGMKSNI